MAYDPNASYEPPRRAYYGQPQQPPPAQNGYGNYSSSQNQYEGHGGYQQYDDRSYGNGHNGQQQHGYADEYAPVSPYDDNGYGGMNGYSEQSHSYDNRNQQQQQQRQYDARYQQRPDRNHQQDYDRQQQRRPDPRARDPSRDGRQREPSRNRPDPRNARQQQPQQESRPPPQSRSSDRQYPPQTNGPSSSSRNAPPPPSSDARRAQPSGPSMEEWKARERERMHAENASPQNRTWDNAFPVFPVIQQKRDRSKARSGDGGSRSPTRRSADVQQGRPGTSASSSQQQLQNGRPGTSRENSSQDARRPLHGNGYHDDHDNNNALEKSRSRGEACPQLQPLQYGMAQRGQTGDVHSPVKEYGQPQWGDQGHSMPPPPMQPEKRASPPQTSNRYDNGGYGTQQQQQPTNYGQPPQSQQQIPRKPRAPAVAPIDTHQPLQQPRPAYMDHQPLSPVSVPPRPSTASGTRNGARYDKELPTDPTQTMYDTIHGQGQQPIQQSWSSSSMGRQNDNTYSSNGAAGSNGPATASTVSPLTREEEIEAEMPDFDSAAPSQTSMLHKRTQNPTSPATSGMPSHSMNTSAQSLPSPVQQPMGRQEEYSSSNSLPEHRGMQQQQQQGGRVMGDYGGNGSGQYYNEPDPYGDNNGYQQRQPPPHQQRGPPPASFQPPFANEQVPRRSMDDARQMPYRPGPQQRPGGPNGPPQSRGPPGGHPGQQSRGPRGPPGGPAGPNRHPQGRQGMDRNYQGPPQFRPDPVQDRGQSAPPTRLDQQSSYSQQQAGYQDPPSSAPPTQQTFAGAGGGVEKMGSPDRLPHHPTPVRPGLMEQKSSCSSSKKPRDYDNAPASSGTSSKPQRKPSSDRPKQPVTNGELNQLRAAVDNAPPNNPNPKKALELVKRLVEASTVLASESGRADPRQTAKNRERYLAEAYKRLKRLSLAGYADAQFYLADCYGQGQLGLEPDEKEAFNLYQAAAKGNHPQAAFRTAVCCEIGPEAGGGTRKDFAKAVQWYRRAAALGDTAGMFKLGIILLRGLLGQQPNIPDAISWLKRSAEQADAENPHALYELASLYESNPSSKVSSEIRHCLHPDDSRARELFSRAAKLGHRSSQFRLGQAYEYGTLGLPIDHRSSIAWYTKSAAQGDHQAELALAGWYLTGAEGVLEHSDTEAYLWARKAASSEPPLAKAMYAMGHFTETGIGCPANLEEAKRWYGRAASYKFPKAQERLEELRRNPNRGGGGGGGAAGGAARGPDNNRLTRKDQKRDEAECSVM